MEEKKYNAADITKKLGLAKTTILRWEREGKIPSAKRDRLGWRYWNEREFNDILAIADGRLEEKLPPRFPDIDIRPAEEKFLRASFLPELSKAGIVSKEQAFKEYRENNFSEVKLGTVAVLAALVFFGSSSASSTFAGGFKNSWFAFERGFAFSTARLNSSGKFIGSLLEPFSGSGKFIDDGIFKFFADNSSFLAREGYAIKIFYKEGGAGLWEGAEILGGEAREKFSEFGENIIAMQERGGRSGEELANFARDSLNTDLLALAGGINFSLRDIAGNSSFVRELAQDWEFIAPDVKALPRSIFSFYEVRTRDAIFAAGDIFEIGSYFAIDFTEKTSFSFNNLGGKLALAEGYTVVEFLIGR